LTARTSYDQAREQDAVAYPTGLPDPSTTVDTYSFRGSWWNGELKLSGTVLEKHQVTVGTEITDNLRQDQGSLIPIGNVFVPFPGSSLIWALYGQDEFAITHTLTLSAGARYDHYSDFGGTTNPRLGLIYHLFHPTTLKLLYGTAFRAPSPYELAPDYGPFYENHGWLQPETIRSVEGVVEQGIGQHFTLSGSVFRNWINQLISLETDSSTGLLAYSNSEKAVATGLEVELDGRLANGLQGRASYSYADVAVPVIDGVLGSSPRHLGKLNLSVPVVRQRLFASLDAQYTSSRLTLAGNTVSGFPVFNLTLLGHTLGRHLDLSTSVYNLFDKKYFDPGRPEDPKTQFSSKEEASASNSRAGFEAQHALLGQRRILALASATAGRFGDWFRSPGVPTRSVGAAPECHRRPGESRLSRQLRKTRGVAQPRFTRWSVTSGDRS